jgi:FkbM family methyltransferase
MLFPVETLANVWQIKPTGVLHVGAHEAEELNEYRKFGWGKVIWVEAQPNLADKLKSTLNRDENLVIEAAVWNKTGIKFDLKITSNSQSTSLLNFGSLKTKYPEISLVDTVEVISVRLDDILTQENEFNFVNLDIQGVELEALQGMGVFLDKVEWIYSEVNKEQVYESCATVDDIDVFLLDRGFERIATRWVHGKGWGDALYVRTGSVIPTKQRFLSTSMKIAWNLKPVINYMRHPRHLLATLRDYLVK